MIAQITQESPARNERRVTDKISLLMFSGTADRFIPLGVMAQAAAALGMEVNIFVTGFALQGFLSERKELPFPKEFAAMAPAIAKGLEETHTPSWDTMVREAKAFGAKIYACSMMCGVMGLTKADFNDLVDGIVGAATFLKQAEGGQTLFI
jgi:peroxiredoxin family protein